MSINSKIRNAFEKRNKKFYLSHASNSSNDISSKSLLANVLDINDDFGVMRSKRLKIPKENGMVGNHLNRFNSYEQEANYLNRENSLNSDINESTLSSLSKAEVQSLKLNLNLIFCELKYLTKKIRDDEDDESKSLYWKFAAMVIDRLCIIFFALATLISTIIILFSSKNFFRFR
jgi:hypothetical protein